MNTIAAKLDQAIKAVCPIVGVSIGKIADKATWSIDFVAEATTQQRTDAQAVLDVFEVAAAELPPAPDNGKALDQSRRDAARAKIEEKIGSLSEDQQVVFREMLKLIDKEV